MGKAGILVKREKRVAIINFLKVDIKRKNKQTTVLKFLITLRINWLRSSMDRIGLS